MKRYSLRLLATAMFVLLSSVPPLQGQGEDRAPPFVEAQGLFEKNCSTCHTTAASAAKHAPARQTLMKLTPEAIFSALNSVMGAQAKDLNDRQKRLLAEFLGGRPLGSTQAGDAKVMANRCPASPPLSDPSGGPAWNGWGSTVENTRFQAAPAAGLAASQVPQLKLKWAFGFPYGTQAYGQPTISGGRVFVGSDTGFVYSLDASTGCVHWSSLAEAGVRTAISVGPVEGRGSAKYAVYFGDVRSNVYALNAATGDLIWEVHVEDHPSARITGAPKLYAGRLYVPVSGGEEGVSINPNFPCCTFRGSVVALDANTGRRIWKTYVIPQKPRPTRKNSAGTQLWAPAGAAIWSSPTVDTKRHALYVGTGDAYTEPAAETSDAIVALDLDTGKFLWVVQDTKHDTWMLGCGPNKHAENCPKNLGPDWDFAASPMLVTMTDGRQLLVAASKSGTVLGLDPDRKGAFVWKVALAEKRPGASGLIVFGGSTDEETAYFALNQVGGLAAIELVTGERKWFRPVPPADIPGEAPRPGQSAAVTSIPGVVFSGAWDGVLRAFSSTDGRVIWEYNTVHEFATVNAVPAKGGSMGAPGPTVASGMLFVGSGYVGVSDGLPGNVLLAFSAD
jgi:polyvinyl alcohol dehydrogenase (cytochrome)